MEKNVKKKIHNMGKLVVSNPSTWVTHSCVVLESLLLITSEMLPNTKTTQGIHSFRGSCDPGTPLLPFQVAPLLLNYSSTILEYILSSWNKKRNVKVYSYTHIRVYSPMCVEYQERCIIYSIRETTRRPSWQQG